MRRSECEFYLKKKTLLNYSSSATEFNGASPTIFFSFPKSERTFKKNSDHQQVKDGGRDLV